MDWDTYKSILFNAGYADFKGCRFRRSKDND